MSAGLVHLYGNMYINNLLTQRPAETGTQQSFYRVVHIPTVLYKMQNKWKDSSQTVWEERDSAFYFRKLGFKKTCF